MLEIINKTPFEVAIAPGMDKEGYDYAVVAVKGTFDIKHNEDAQTVSETQVPIKWASEYYGEPGKSSVKYEMDTCLTKKGTDVVLIGHAYAQGKPTKAVDVGIQAGSLRKILRVFGDRRWYKAVGFWRSTDPIPFDRMPLVYERAFGGVDDSHANPAKHSLEQRNPAGTGFAVSGSKERLEGLPLPNLEDPGALIESWNDKPTPAGLGFIGHGWLPRAKYAGTYDDRWREERCPLLPEDFDEFFFNGASPDLIASEYFQGGESIRMINVTPEGEFIFKLPRLDFDITVWIKGQEKNHHPNLDTVIIEPDEHRVILVWRATVPCFREFLHVDRVQVTEKT